MAYKINGTTVVDNSRNVCACCVTSCCITASDRMDAPSGNTASRPGSPATGSIYFDTDLGQLLSYNGTDWTTSAATTADAQDFSNTFWSYGTINNCENYCKANICCLCLLCSGLSIRGGMVNPASVGNSTISGQVRACFDCIGSVNLDNNCVANIKHVYRGGLGGSNENCCFTCGYACKNAIAGCSTRGQGHDSCTDGDNSCLMCSLGRLKVFPDGSMMFKLKANSENLMNILTCSQMCTWNEAYVNPKGGMILSKDVGKEINHTCLSGTISFIPEGFFYHPSYGINTPQGPTVGYAMSPRCRPGAPSSGGLTILPCFIVCTNSSMFTNDEELCDVAFVQPCCQSNCRPSWDGKGIQPCFKFIACHTPELCFAYFCCSCCCNFCYSSHLIHTSSRTDLSACTYPHFFNREIFTCQRYNCNGACIDVPDQTCCPLAIASFTCLGNVNTCRHVLSPCCQTEMMWSKDGCCLNFFKHQCVQCGTLKVWQSSTACCACNYDNFGFINTKVNRITCDIQNYVYLGWKCFLWWQCCKGCTFGTDAIGACDGLGVCSSRIFCCMGIASCDLSTQPQVSHSPSPDAHFSFIAKNVATPVNYGRGWIRSCGDPNRSYFLTGCSGCSHVGNGIPFVSVYCETTNNFECMFDFERIFVCPGETTGDWLNMFFKPPALWCTCAGICNGGSNFCYYVNTDTANPHCCIAACIQAITGCDQISLAYHCEGFNPFASRSFGVMYACDDYRVRTPSNSNNFGFYINPVTDHAVYIGGFGIPQCTNYVSSNRFMLIAAICVDLTNCCVSKVNVLFPSTKDIMNKFDHRTCGGCSCVENPSSYFFCFSNPMGSRSCSSTAAGDCGLSKGIDLVTYGAPDFTNTYGGDCGGIVLWYDEMCAYRTGPLNCCECINSNSCFFGCQCTLGCAEFTGYSKCCNKCVGAWTSQGFVQKLPYNYPFECIGWRTSTFYKNIFTWYIEGTKTYDPFGSDKGNVANNTVFCENNRKTFPGFIVCNCNTTSHGGCLKLCNSIKIVCHDSNICSFNGSTACTFATYCCTLGLHFNCHINFADNGMYKNLKPCLYGDTDNTTKLYSRCIRSTNRRYEGSLYNQTGTNFAKPQKFETGEDMGAWFIRIWNENIACTC